MPDFPKKTLVADAYSRLKSDIRENRLPPGFQAPEPELATRLGISRTPVREALIRLQADGLIRLIPRHGALVVALSPSDVQSLYDILSALEPQAGVTLAEAAPTPTALAPLYETLDAMTRALEAKDLSAWLAADDSFHQQVIALQGNDRLHSMLGPLLDQLHRVLMTTLAHREQLARATEDHRTLLHILAAGDSNAARRELRQHRRRESREVLEIIEAQGLTAL
ncbi:GntR family transcriptional regulator [Shimia thalassica]|uniref:GntR family transcriptional regulator n=1 Tax=Shimia thalassica TaxID=1715693 RepID=UPI002732DC0E|nr:GntR family transcriptional regulator [Shimia thalassica]MDP2519599.1 GntR family transcriptional regulator [Shimia thalassica]